MRNLTFLFIQIWTNDNQQTLWAPPTMTGTIRYSAQGIHFQVKQVCNLPTCKSSYLLEKETFET